MAFKSMYSVLLDRELLFRTERELLERLDLARATLDESMRAVWLSCLVGEVSDLRKRRLCDDSMAEVDRLDRELVGVRSALRGLGEDLGDRDHAA